MSAVVSPSAAGVLPPLAEHKTHVNNDPLGSIHVKSLNIVCLFNLNAQTEAVVVSQRSRTVNASEAHVGAGADSHQRLRRERR